MYLEKLRYEGNHETLLYISMKKAIERIEANFDQRIVDAPFFKEKVKTIDLLPLRTEMDIHRWEMAWGDLLAEFRRKHD